MNRSFSILSFTAVAAVLSTALILPACVSPPPAASNHDGDALVERPKPTANSVVLVAHGMACPKCVSNADLQLMKLDGVRAVAIDMKHGFITVEVDPDDRPTRDDYARAIDAAGLTLVSVHEAADGAATP